MTSLTELNNFADGVVSYTDNRTSDVIFNFPNATDITSAITSTSFTLERNIDIVEIIQPSAALVVFTVDVSSLSGATVTFASMPSGCVLTTPSAGVYEVSGITSVSNWDTIKTPTINIPTGTEGGFEFSCTIGFTRNGTRINQSWNIGNFKAVATLASTATISCTPKKYHGASAHPIMVVNIEQAEVELAIISRFNIVCNNTRIKGMTSELAVVSTFTNNDIVENVRFLDYYSNQPNKLFDQGSSAKFDGQSATGGLSASRLEIQPANSGDFIFGGNDAFTVEFFFYIESDTGNDSSCLISNKTGLASTTTDMFILWRNLDRKLQIYASQDMNIAAATSALNIDQWYHVILVKNSNNVMSLYVDGVLQQRTTAANTGIGSVGRENLGLGAFVDNSLPLNVKQPSDSGGDAWIDELRVSATNRYDPTLDVVDVSAPFTNQQYDRVLMHAGGVDGSTTFLDDNDTSGGVTRSAATITAYRNAQVSTEQSMFANSATKPKITQTSDYIKVEVSSGYIGLSTDEVNITNNYIEITGGEGYMGNLMGLLTYYNTYNATGDVQITFTLRNGGSTGTIVDQWKSSIKYLGVGSIPSTDWALNTFTVGTHTYNLSLQTILYGKLDLIAVGAGGGGAYEGGGGGGGGALSVQNLLFTDPAVRSYSIVVGAGGPPGGGASGATYPNAVQVVGGPGGNTTAFGYTVTGGQGGEYFENYNSSTTTIGKDGGNSGSVTDPTNTLIRGVFVGGNGDFVTSGQNNGQGFGGGGAGANQNGQPYNNGSTSGYPGSGIVAWNNNEYGKGGHGEASSESNVGYTMPSNTGEGGRYGFITSSGQGPYTGSDGVVIIDTNPR